VCDGEDGQEDAGAAAIRDVVWGSEAQVGGWARVLLQSSRRCSVFSNAEKKDFCLSAVIARMVQQRPLPARAAAAAAMGHAVQMDMLELNLGW
jgi:hypothetical protein